MSDQLPDLDRDALLSKAACELPIRPLDIPDLGGRIYVKGMSGKQRDSFEAWATSEKGPKNIRGKAAARCIVDKDGKRQYTDHDADALGNVKVSILQKVFSAIQELSGMTNEDVDELEQTSAATVPGGDSSSTSQPG